MKSLTERAKQIPPRLLSALQISVCKAEKYFSKAQNLICRLENFFCKQENQIGAPRRVDEADFCTPLRTQTHAFKIMK
jgi:hypothetical protein